MKSFFLLFLALFFIYFFDVFGIQNPYFRDILAGTDEIHFIYPNPQDNLKIDTTILKNKRLINDFTREITENFLDIKSQKIKLNKKSHTKIIFFRKKFKILLCESFIFKENNNFLIIFLQKNKFYTQEFSLIQQNILSAAIDFPDFIRNL